ncbi:MAG TPA: lysylphosphatidylglycerol synthase transmembrane domain-containing protein [Terriglobales bacterium]|nr:lysylphosphatidylglycerol synthase transmembrane domain-containing protein [Terriglobales bacterium]
MMSESSLTQTLPSPEAARKSLTSKQVFTLGIVVFTGALVFLQWRSWQTFDWKTFLSATSGLSWLQLAAAVGLSLLTFPLRALRWQIFLRPMRDARFDDVLYPTLIGFTGLALLGRPGELVRPYMIARRTDLTMASQMGVWMVERIFDMGAFIVMAAVAFLFASSLPDLRQFLTAAWITAGVIIAMAIAAIIMCKARQTIFCWLEQTVTMRYPATRVALSRAQAFTAGLHTIKDGISFVQLSLISIAIWLLTAFSYVTTLHAYPSLRTSSFSAAMLLMGFSMIGGLVQLPAVGGGAQLATIVAMVDLLGFPRELAVSAGILLWLVSFHAVTPIGLLLARRAHVSFSRASGGLSNGEQERPNQADESPCEQVPPMDSAFSNPCYQESGNA